MFVQDNSKYLSPVVEAAVEWQGLECRWVVGGTPGQSAALESQPFELPIPWRSSPLPIVASIHHFDSFASGPIQPRAFPDPLLHHWDLEVEEEQEVVAGDY